MKKLFFLIFILFNILNIEAHNDTLYFYQKNSYQLKIDSELLVTPLNLHLPNPENNRKQQNIVGLMMFGGVSVLNFVCLYDFYGVRLNESAIDKTLRVGSLLIYNTIFLTGTFIIYFHGK